MIDQYWDTNNNLLMLYYVFLFFSYVIGVYQAHSIVLYSLKSQYIKPHLPKIEFAIWSNQIRK